MATPIQTNPNAVGNRNTTADVERRPAPKSGSEQAGTASAAGSRDDSVSLSSAGLQLSGQSRSAAAVPTLHNPEDAAAVAQGLKSTMIKAGALALLAHGAGASDKLSELLQPA